MGQWAMGKWVRGLWIKGGIGLRATGKGATGCGGRIAAYRLRGPKWLEGAGCRAIDEEGGQIRRRVAGRKVYRPTGQPWLVRGHPVPMLPKGIRERPTHAPSSVPPHMCISACVCVWVSVRVRRACCAIAHAQTYMCTCVMSIKIITRMHTHDGAYTDAHT